MHGRVPRFHLLLEWDLSELTEVTDGAAFRLMIAGGSRLSSGNRFLNTLRKAEPTVRSGRIPQPFEAARRKRCPDLILIAMS